LEQTVGPGGRLSSSKIGLVPCQDRPVDKTTGTPA
jgi:hypothetical protein